jgi:hypothetical protein
VTHRQIILALLTPSLCLLIMSGVLLGICLAPQHLTTEAQP